MINDVVRRIADDEGHFTHNRIGIVTEVNAMHAKVSWVIQASDAMGGSINTLTHLFPSWVPVSCLSLVTTPRLIEIVHALRK